jgi:hypothetical protein
MCLARSHAAAIVERENDVRRWFAGCDADNECDLGTTLNLLGKLGECSREHTHFVSWPGRPASFHPRDTAALSDAVIRHARARGPRACFFRKVAPRCDLRALYRELGITY